MPAICNNYFTINLTALVPIQWLTSKSLTSQFYPGPLTTDESLYFTGLMSNPDRLSWRVITGTYEGVTNKGLLHVRAV